MLDLEENLPFELKGDQYRLRQVLIHIISNAIKFTERGAIWVVVAYDAMEQFLKVRIIDTGKGLKPKQMPTLFKMFGTLSRTAAQNSSGLGMGLTICKPLVENNHG